MRVALACVLTLPLAACAIDGGVDRDTAAVTPQEIGCADGQREGFVDVNVNPDIAGCSGGFAIGGVMGVSPGTAPACPGLATNDSVNPACARGGGDDGANPTGAGCNAADLCASGWHVCDDAADVADSASSGCALATLPGDPPLFFASRQSSNGCGLCATGTRTDADCDSASCTAGCEQNANLSNDVFGCGNIGAAASGCGPLDRFSHDQCGALAGTSWSCNDASSGLCEAYVVHKSDASAGGVLCCRDRTPPNNPPVARCRDVTVAANATCSGCASVDAGSSDPDEDPITCVESPSCGFALGTTVVTVTCTDSRGASSSCTGSVTIADVTPPSIRCPASQVLECVDDGAVATYTPAAADNCPLSTSCTPPSGSKLPLGTTPVSCSATDPAGASATCGLTVTVQDTLPPVITYQRVSLWPPNHRYVSVALDDCATVLDQCDGRISLAQHGRITGVTSDEIEDAPDRGNGNGNGNGNDDGHTCNDIGTIGTATVDLRAEREGGGDGRVYTIAFTVQDRAGHAVNGACKIEVPHDQSGRPAIDSGPAPGHDPACND